MDLGSAVDAIEGARRFLAPVADRLVVAWLVRRGFAAPPPLRRAGPDGSLRCAAARALATAAGAPPETAPEWGVDDGSPTAPVCAAATGQLELLRSLPDERCWGAEVCEAAAWRGDNEMLRWLRERLPPCPWDEGVCAAAAEGGHGETLAWLLAQGAPWDEWTCAAFAERGDLEFLGRLKALRPPSLWGSAACESAARRGRLEALAWLRAQSCPWDRARCREVALWHPAVRAWIDAQAD